MQQVLWNIPKHVPAVAAQMGESQDLPEAIQLSTVRLL